MKTALFFLLLFINIVTFSSESDKVIGIWLIESTNAKVELYKTSNGTLEGKIVWLRNGTDKNGQPIKDVKNEDKKMRDRLVLGSVMATGFTWNEAKKTWENGKVYVADNGNTYCGSIKLKPDGTLSLRGFICSLKFLGKTSYCTRCTL